MVHLPIGYSSLFSDWTGRTGRIEDDILVTEKGNQVIGKPIPKTVSEIEEISLLESTDGEFRSSYYCISVLLNDKMAEKRFEIVKTLKKNGVGTSVYYPRPVFSHKG